MANIRKIEAIRKPTEYPKIRVAAYARVSTDKDDQLVSLKTQKQHYESYIKANPTYEYAGLYYDEGLSGTKVETRNGLLKLLKDCEDKKIDRVITKSISRLSRNTTNTLEIVRKLSLLKISIYFEKENIDTLRMDSELMLSILSSIAESESISTSANVKWSNEKRFKEGTYKLSSAAYGYKCIDGQLYPDEEEATIVKEIFKMALEGKGTSVIAAQLNSMNIKPRLAKKWDPGCVYAILKNEKYTGDALFQKYYVDSTFTERQNRGEKNQYYVKAHHEALISHEEFELVNSMINMRSCINNINSRSTYVFTKKIECGQCGHRYIKTKVGRDGYFKTKWACKNHISDKDECSNLPEKDEDLKIAFIKVMKKLEIGRKRVLDPFIKALRKYDTSNIKNQIKEIEKMMNNTEIELNTLSSLYESKHLNATQYYEEQQKIKNEITILNKNKMKFISEINDIATHLQEAKKLSNYLSKNNTFDGFDDDLFSEYVDSIIIVKRKTYIFKMKCGLKLQEEIEDEQ